MADHKTVQVPLQTPGLDECQQCVLRLQQRMEQTKGVAHVEMAERGGSMTIDFDPDLVTVRKIEEFWLATVRLPTFSFDQYTRSVVPGLALGYSSRCRFNVGNFSHTPCAESTSETNSRPRLSGVG